MDTSNKHTSESFQTLKLYAKGIIDEYKIGDESRASLLSYDSSPEVLVDINSKATGKDIKSIIDSLQFNTNSRPRLSQVLNEIVNLLNERQNTIRSKVPVNVLVLSKGKIVWAFFLNIKLPFKSGSRVNLFICSALRTS